MNKEKLKESIMEVLQELDMIPSNLVSDMEEETQEVPEKSLEVRVSNVLHELGVPSHIRGYRYLRTAIIMVVEDVDLLNNITKGLYTSIAKVEDTTGSRVERAMRHAIETSWHRANYELTNKIFKYTIKYEKSKPCNSEYIAIIADNLRLGLI